MLKKILWIGVLSWTTFMLAGPVGRKAFDLRFSTYFGGTGFDAIRDLCVDKRGNIIAVGGTTSADFPTTPGAYCRTYGSGGSSLGGAGPCDVWVAKFSSDGRLLWSTFFGGPNYDRAYGVEVDPQGYIYVTGRAGEGLPVTPGVFQPHFVDTAGADRPGYYGTQNGFVAKFTPAGQLMWASYVGSGQLCRDIAVDDHGDIYLPSGWNGVGQPPPASWFAKGYQKAPKGDGGDSCVLKVKSDGTQVLWGTWLCGSGVDGLAAMVRVDAKRNVYFANYTASKDMPTPGNGRHTFAGGPNDFYVAKLSPGGSDLIYGTYEGGSGDEIVGTHELTVDAQGNAYIAVWTTSTDWPVTPGAFQPSPGGGGNDLAICKIGPDGVLLACSYLAGDGDENAEGMTVDKAGNLYVTGTTHSRNFPMAGNPYQSTYGEADGNFDGNAFLTIIAPDVKSLVYSSYMGRQCSITGQNAYGGIHASDLMPNGSLVVGGSWLSAGWPTKNAFQPTFKGDPLYTDHCDAVLAEFRPAGANHY